MCNQLIKISLAAVIICSCNDLSSSPAVAGAINTSLIQPSKKTVGERYNPPEGYKRPDNPTPFHRFMLQLPLKNWDAPVLYFDGTTKPNRGVYNSVIDLPIGSKDLHQCADACMRLRADFLYSQKQYDKIKFNYLSDNKPRYFKDYAKGDYNKDNYWKYMEQIFSYANTASLHNELPAVAHLNDLKVGDILLEKKTPYGHAVIAIDMATNAQGEKVVLLAQSYMPAQELQILNNPGNAALSPWYIIKEGRIATPEWNFNSTHWKTWE